MVQESFGRFARRQRQAAGLGLRQAARLMGMSATYLSRVESDTDPPSAKLLHEMANAYKLPISDLAAQARARIGDRSAAAAHGLALESSAELRALYRMGTSLSAEEIQQFLRDYLREKKGFSENEIEYELAKLKSELPRIVKGRDDMFASQVRPRRLSKERIDKAAYSLLARYGLDEKTFSPPTPVELIVEQEPGIKYRIDKLACKKTGEPLVLGLTGWNDDGDREIIINGVLADSSNKTDGHRFNFTLAHELFHAIEHLPLTAPAVMPGMARIQFCDTAYSPPLVQSLSGAARAVDRWAAIDSGPRSLNNDEDWREWQANTFAAALLMPRWGVTTEFQRRLGTDSINVPQGSKPREVALEIAGGILFNHVVYERSLGEIFAVSRQAMAIRLLDLKLVREG